MRTACLFVITAIWSCGISGMASAQSPTAQKGVFKTEETRLGSWDDMMKDFAFSRDGHHFAYLTNRKCGKSGRLCVILDGQVYARVKEFGIGTLALSPDGKHIAYAARKSKSWWNVVVDGQAQAGPDARGILVGTPIFSPDGKRIAAGMLDCVVVDGKPDKSYGLVRSTSLTFSPDSNRIAYIAYNSKRSFVIVDGQADADYDDVFGLTFSPDSKRVAYAAKNSDQWRVVVNGKPGAGFREIGRDSPVFSPDSQHVAYAARTGAGWSLVVDEKLGQQYKDIRLPLSWDSNVFATQLRDVLSHGGHGPHTAGLFESGMNLRSRNAVFIRAGTISGQGGPGTGARLRVFSPDGRHVAYAAAAGGGKSWKVIVDGQASGDYYDIGPGSPTFSPDGTRVAYAARTGMGWKSWSLFVDGKSLGEYAEIGPDSPIFSPDGKHVAFAAQTGLGLKWSVLLDGVAGPKYEGILRGSPFFDADGTLEFLAVKKKSAFGDGDLYRVKYIPTP